MADLENTLHMDLAKGRVVIELLPKLAPGHVARIKELAREGFYDGVVFHRVIEGFMVLLLFQLAGEAIAHVAHAPIPGPIIGLLLLLIWARLGGVIGASATQVARGLLSNLGLMFVPVAAGIVFQLRSLGNAAWHVGWIVVVTTAFTLVVTAGVFAWLSKLTQRDA